MLNIYINIYLPKLIMRKLDLTKYGYLTILQHFILS